MIGTLWWWEFANLDVAGGCGCVARVWRRTTRQKKEGCSGWRAAGPRSRRRNGSRGEDWRNAGRSGPKELGLSNVRAATWVRRKGTTGLSGKSGTQLLDVDHNRRRRRRVRKTAGKQCGKQRATVRAAATAGFVCARRTIELVARLDCGIDPGGKGHSKLSNSSLRKLGIF